MLILQFSVGDTHRSLLLPTSILFIKMSVLHVFQINFLVQCYELNVGLTYIVIYIRIILLVITFKEIRGGALGSIS